jgi:hypothetical protein
MEKRAVLMQLSLDYLEKEAIDAGTGLLMAAGGLGAAGVAVLGASLLSKVYGDSFGRQMAKMPKEAPSSIVRKLKVAAGMQDLPYVTVKGYQNAHYQPAASVTSQMQEVAGRAEEEARQAGDKSSERFYRTVQRIGKSSHGGIFVGDTLTNPHIIAHEVGHALADNEPALKRYVERSPSTLNKLFGIGALAGTVAGALKPEWIPKIGLGLAGLGAANVAAETYSERKATERGLELMGKAGLPPSSRGRQALETAGQSYLWPGLTAKVLAPLAAAGAAKLIQSWKA